MIEEYNVLIASVGGQGGITLARILSNAALSQGLNVRVGETLGMAQRGGSVQSHVRFGGDVHGPLIPERGSDVLLSLEPAEALRVAKYIGKKTTVIMNTHPVLPTSVLLNETTYPEIDQILSILRKIGGSVHPLNALELAKKAGFSRSLNIVMLGAYVALGNQILTLDAIKEAMVASLPSRYMEQNMRALEMGIVKMRESI
ncbi:MAG: indolepyruvate ferredoxin oxidoreductase subunit beta [Candidatus Bathyarchaeota archaeon]|nr:indolepyruvate ferredoxin oxidoreductase subunit beta [Candidatus Bathyarchaeota archaeon]